MRLLSVRRKRTPESGAVSTVTASWVTPVSEASDSMSPAHEATYESSTSSSARLAPCGWHDRSSEYSPVCECRTRQNSPPSPSRAEVRPTRERMPGSMALPPSIGASRPERYRFAPVRCAAIHVRFSTARSTMLRCSRSLIASTRMTPMPTTRIAMAATTLAMLTSSVQVNTPMPAIVNGMPMLRMPPGIGRIQSPYVVFDAMIIRISLMRQNVLPLRVEERSAPSGAPSGW